MKLDKQHEAQSAAGDSISSVGVPVTVKEYTPSEVFTEPLPAYKKARATTVQIARIAAFTVIACTTILGLCIIASSWIEATASCSQLIHAEALLHQQQNDDIADRPSYQALAVDPLQSEESSESKQESIAAAPMSQQKEQNAASQNSVPIQSQFDSQSTPIQIKLPLQLDLDDIASSLMEKNQRSRMNCVIEKKRAEEVMDHQPKTVRLPFGVNITTDPRYEHVTGERMAIYCESGHDQRNLPMENMQPQPQQQTPVIVPMPMNLPLMMPNPQMGPPQPQMPGPMNQIPLSMITRASPEESQMQQKDETPITIVTREEHVIPIFQQAMPDMRQINTNSIEQRMPEKILYHPAAPEARMMQERMMAEGRMLHTLAIPEGRPIPMAEGRSISHSGVPMPSVPSDMVRPPPPPAFQKIPIHVPTILQPVEPQQANENTLEEETESEPRPHYVQPRSVRSVDAQLHPREKRARRYACSCTC